MARISKSDRLKTGLYMSKKSGNLIEIRNPWLEQFYDVDKGELLYLDTAIIVTEKIALPRRVGLDNDTINNLEYIGKL